VVAEHKQTDYKALPATSGKWNSKSPSAITKMGHHRRGERAIGGDWEMLSSTYKYTKTAAFAAQFNVPSPRRQAVLKYRIRARW